MRIRKNCTDSATLSVSCRVCRNTQGAIIQVIQMPNSAKTIEIRIP